MTYLEYRLANGLPESRETYDAWVAANASAPEWQAHLESSGSYVPGSEPIDYRESLDFAYGVGAGDAVYGAAGSVADAVSWLAGTVGEGAQAIWTA